MKIDVIKLDGKKAGSVELVDDVFGLEPRADICTELLGGSAMAPKLVLIR